MYKNMGLGFLPQGAHMHLITVPYIDVKSLKVNIRLRSKCRLVIMRFRDMNEINSFQTVDKIREHFRKYRASYCQSAHKESLDIWFRKAATCLSFHTLEPCGPQRLSFCYRHIQCRAHWGHNLWLRPQETIQINHHHLLCSIIVKLYDFFKSFGVLCLKILIKVLQKHWCWFGWTGNQVWA